MTISKPTVGQSGWGEILNATLDELDVEKLDVTAASATYPARLGGTSPVAAAFAYVNVKDYGAVGNGVADDSAAFLAAVAALPNGGTIFVPKGTYKLSSTVQFTTTTINEVGGRSYRIQGAGAMNTIINYTGNDWAFKLGDATTNDLRFSYIEDLTIVGNPTASGAILLNGTQSCGVRNVTIQNFTRADAVGILVPFIGAAFYNYFNELTRLRIRNVPIGVKFESVGGQGGNSNTLSESVFVTHSTACVVVDGASGNRILNNEFNGSSAIGVLTLNNARTTTLAHNIYDGTTLDVRLSSAGTEDTIIIHGGLLDIEDSGTRTIVLGALQYTPQHGYHELNPFAPSKTDGAWIVSVEPALLRNGQRFTESAQVTPTYALHYDLDLSAGLWDLTLIHVRASNRGVYSVRLDGTQVATINGHSAATINNAIDTASFTVTRGGTRRVSLAMIVGAGGGYAASVIAVTLRRRG